MTHHNTHVQMVCSRRQHKGTEVAGFGTFVLLSLIVVFLILHFAWAYVQQQEHIEGLENVVRAREAALYYPMDPEGVVVPVPPDAVWSTVSRTAGGHTVTCEFGPGRLSIYCGPAPASPGSTGRSYSDPRQSGIGSEPAGAGGRFFTWARRWTADEPGDMPRSGKLSPLNNYQGVF